MVVLLREVLAVEPALQLLIEDVVILVFRAFFLPDIPDILLLLLLFVSLLFFTLHFYN
jgi:hypothetical protein